MKLSDLRSLIATCRTEEFSYSQFRADPALTAVQWPDDVLRQVLFDHGDHFLDDYGDLAPNGVTWRVETIPAADFHGMPTGKSDSGYIEHIAENPVWWVGCRPLEARRCWEERGTWLQPPLLIDRSLLDPRDSGLQVLEGRTRVGILRGRLREELRVAPEHQAWVGRPC